MGLFYILHFFTLWQHLVFATVDLIEANGSNTTGQLFIQQSTPESDVIIRGDIYNLESGEHGFHVHTDGATGNDCSDAGGHFNPTDVSMTKSCYFIGILFHSHKSFAKPATIPYNK